MIKHWNILFLSVLMTSSVVVAETLEPEDLTHLQIGDSQPVVVSPHSLKRAEEVLVDVADRLRQSKENATSTDNTQIIPSDLPAPRTKKSKDAPVVRPYRGQEKMKSDALAFPSAESDFTYNSGVRDGDKEDVREKNIRMKLRELAILRRAAQMAGGDIKVSIKTLGITRDDLLVPLGQLGVFDIIANDDGSVNIESKNEDPYLENLQDEVKNLEQRRRALLADMSVLENVTGLNTAPQRPVVAQTIQQSTWDTPGKTSFVNGVKIETPPIRWVSVPNAAQAANSAIPVNQISSPAPQTEYNISERGSAYESSNSVVVLNPVVPKL